MSQKNEEERSPLFLALDCGELPLEQVAHYQTYAAYQRAKTVWNALYAHMTGKGGYISTRTTISYGHAYIVAYAQHVPISLQQQVFRVMDTYRQQWRATFPGEDFPFVQFPQSVREELYQARKKAISDKQNRTGYSISENDIGELYETHTPHVMVSNENAPYPIDPPFESIPLYYEKQEDKKQRQQPKGSSKKTFLERYLTSLRLDYEQEERAMRKQHVSSSTLTKLAAVGQSILDATLLSRKYRFTPSAMAMAHALMGQGATCKTLPSLPVLIEFVEPIDFSGLADPLAGLAFMQPFTVYQQWVGEERAQREKIFGYLPQEQLSRLWGANILASDGGALFNLLYDSMLERWRVPEVRRCLTGECVQTMEPDEMVARGAWTNWDLCPTCTELLAFFSHWIPIALLMIDGEFVEEQEPEMQEVEESVTYKEKRAGTGKYDEKRASAQWRIVSFDASVVKRKPAQQTQKQGEREGPSWVEVGIAAGTLFKMDINLGKTQRTLDPMRHPRWKYKRTITVKPHPTKVVVTLETLRKRVQKVTQVTASRYEE